jgi:flagellar biosynthesis protein FlhG
LSHLIAVCSGKGGVGKTFTCINLAAALRDLGREVLIVDADMGLGNAQLMLGVSPKLTLSDYVLDGIPLTQVITKLEEGLQLLPGASGDANIVNLPLTALSDLCHELVALFPDTVVLFDIAAGISEQNMHLLRLCETRIVVFLDEPTSIADSYGVLKLLHRSGHLENTSVVPNQVASLDAGRTFYEKMNHLCLSFLGEPIAYLGSIQDDPAVKSSIRYRKPLHKSFPNSTAWCNIKSLAANIVRQDGPKSALDPDK